MILDAGPVVLRPFQADDRLALIAILTDPIVMARAIVDRPLRRQEAEAFLHDHFGRDGFGTICLASTGEPIGFSGFRPCAYLGADDYEFGWVIGRPHQGHGYATTLGRQLIAHALADAGLGLPRVLAACHPENAASEHVLRDKLMMTAVGEIEVGPGRRRRIFMAERA